MNGFEVSWALRSDSDYWSTASMAGAERGFRRPIDMGELLRAIRYEVANEEFIRKALDGKMTGKRFERESMRLSEMQQRIGMNPFLRQWVESYMRFPYSAGTRNAELRSVELWPRSHQPSGPMRAHCLSHWAGTD